MIENKKLKLILWIVFGIFVCWLCFYMPSQDREHQYEVVEGFYTSLFQYQYEEGDLACGSSPKCDEIYNNIKPYLSKNTLVDNETIDSLVVRPAIFSKVNVSLWWLDSIQANGKYKIDGKTIYQFDVSYSVIADSVEGDEAYTHTLNMFVQLVKERSGWKIHSLEYFANDFLYQ